MSFSKAKLKRFNDIDVATCVSPARHAGCLETVSSTLNGHHGHHGSSSTSSSTTLSTASTTSTHSERKEQIEKFFKDAVRFGSSSTKDSKEAGSKEEKKSKGLRLFRTPSLPHRLRFRQNTEGANSASTSGNGNNNNNNNNNSTATSSSTPMNSVASTPAKENGKSSTRVKCKEALQLEIRKKNELIDNYSSQIDVLRRHVEQLKETESKLREEYSNIQMKTDSVIHNLTTENTNQKEINGKLTAENMQLLENIQVLNSDMKDMKYNHKNDMDAIKIDFDQLKSRNGELELNIREQTENMKEMKQKIDDLEKELEKTQLELINENEKTRQDADFIEGLKKTNSDLITDVDFLKKQMDQDALSYIQETKIIQNEMECLKKERSTLKNDLANKCDLIKSLQDELIDKNCEVDALRDTIRQLLQEKAKYIERENILNDAEEKIHLAELQAEQKVQKLESDLENSLERERAYWKGEMQKRQKLAENEVIKIELEKQDVMVLLETTNDMLRQRDDKLQKYEDQLRNGIDYYVQLTDNLQKQVVDLKQDIAKTITEKYNYQLTLNNTRTTVNILMDRLKKSDSDVEQLKAELESLQLTKGTLEQSYLAMQIELKELRSKLSETENSLSALRSSSETLQKEVSLKETIFNEMLNTEGDTLNKISKIASSFQERVDADVTKYMELYNDLKSKDESRELYMQDMKRVLDEFATVLHFAQIELDNKDSILVKVREECEHLKLENIAIKSKLDETLVTNAVNNTPVKKRENSTDLEKIEGLLIDTEIRAECDKIASWFLNASAEKCIRNESTNEINELLKPAVTPNNKNVRTPKQSYSAGKININTSSNTPNTPLSPCTPKATATLTPRTTPKKSVLFAGKENIPSPTKQVLKARNL